MALLQHSVIINRRERERDTHKNTHAHKKERLEKNRVLDSSHGRLQSHRQRVKQTRHKITWAASASPCSRHPQHPRFVLCVVLCLGQNGLRAFTRCLILGHKSNEKKNTTLNSLYLGYNVEMLQVILRPRLSTSGRSRQQRLFLRLPSSSLSSASVWTVPASTGLLGRQFRRRWV